MITTIKLHQLLPQVFADAEGTAVPDMTTSDVWLRDLTLSQGEAVLIEAESGRGKTSLFSFLTGLRHDYLGSIIYHDGEREVPCTLQQRLRQSLAVLFQDLRLFPELTAVQNCLLKSQLTQHLSETEIRQKLCELGLAERLDTPCSRLSIGQQQRVAFVRMLCQPADFLLLDEPVSHLDDQNALIMSQMLALHQQQTGAGILVTSIGRRLPYQYDRILHL